MTWGRTRRRRTTIFIDVSEPDTLARISLMNSTLIRLAAGTGLIEIRDADYRKGHLEVQVARPPKVVTTDKRVALYTP